MRHPIALLLALLLPAALAAQSARNTVSPGMSRAGVVAALGAPSTERTVGEFRYLFYTNACGRRCGMNDLVILRRDSVVDAIFRSANRHYTGKSSSPAPISAEDAAERAPSKSAPARPTPAATPATKRMTPPDRPNDVRPSIPTTPPTLAPAPSTTTPSRNP